MKQLEGGGRIPRFCNDSVNPQNYGITPLVGGHNRNSIFRYIETISVDDDVTTNLDREVYYTLTPDLSCRISIVADVESRA